MMFTAGFLFGMGVAWLAVGVLIIVWPKPSTGGRHFVGRNPAANQLRNAINAAHRELRRDIHPWSPRRSSHVR